MSTWAIRVAELRESGLTLAEIGRLIGLSTSAVSDVEKGRTKQPGADSAVKLLELHRDRVGSLVEKTLDPPSSHITGTHG